jgi:SAM-dependent methyltransferase
MTTEEAVLRLRRDPQFADVLRDAYLGPDVRENAERFLASGEFRATLDLIAGGVRGAAILDVGAGTGIASYAFARSGAREVVALEPDPSPVVGHGAIREVAGGLPITIEAAFGESMPFPDARFDVVYARQVLHHARDLDALLRECARVTVPGGLVLGIREHVADNAAQLRAFLAAHPIHRLAGGEHAFPLDRYVGAFKRARLEGPLVLRPLASVINAYPECRDEASLRDLPRALLRNRLRGLGALMSHLPGITALVKWRIETSVPGRLYSFIGRRPGPSQDRPHRPRGHASPRVR